jgi:hypothetical protein
MRLLILIPLAALAACGEEPKAKAPERPQAFQAGQWTNNMRVTTFRQLDQGRPRIDMPAGTQVSGATCIGSGDTRRPAPELFVGEGWQDCGWSEMRMRNGRLTAIGTCRRPGLPEPVNITAVGEFTATSFEGTVEYNTRLASDGDVRVVLESRGQRTGECTAPAEGGNQTRAG